jgi:lysyl-tRNA synthetase class I
MEHIEVELYDIPKKPEFDTKSLQVRQKNFFKDIYNLLIDSERGPRLSTFLWAADRDKVLELLHIEERTL